jgi:hypothetical protein
MIILNKKKKKKSSSDEEENHRKEIPVMPNNIKENTSVLPTNPQPTKKHFDRATMLRIGARPNSHTHL